MTNFFLLLKVLDKLISVGSEFFKKLDKDALERWNSELDEFTKIPVEKIKTPADLADYARRANDLARGMRKPKN